MELVIAEKPSVARDLARVLGVRSGGGGEHFENDRYAITWCIGHLVELDEPASYDARWKPWRLDVLPMLPTEFRLRAAEHAKKQLAAISKLLRDRRFSAVVNACDAGREGELIFRYVYQHARAKLPVRRLWVSSLTDEAIRRGFAALRPGRELDALADAARSRSEADWLVGMNATRAITVRGRAAGGDQLLSIGRVQTPTLALLVAREHEIRAFVAKPYWEVRGTFQTVDGTTFAAQWRHDKQPRLAAAELAGAVVERDVPGPARVVAVKSKTVREPPPQLFDLTSLQRTANRRFGWSASRTLELAQALYERHKAITYPRTDSRHLSTDVARELTPVFDGLAARPDYAAFARHLLANPPRPNARIVDDSKVRDHHAIIPTSAGARAMDRDEARLYDLIVRRFLGAFFPDAELAVTDAWIRVGAGEGPAPEVTAPDRERLVDKLPPAPDHYLARGRVRLVAGWQEVAGIDPARERPRGPNERGEDDDAPPTGALPPLVVGQPLAGRYEPLAKQTTPPPRYTEAALLAAMETAGRHLDDEALRAAMKDTGLGTPATRAAIIETLLRRRYILRDRQALVPTETGVQLVGFLGAIAGGSLASPELTGSWEARLARIARGEDSRAAFMADIARYVAGVIDAVRGAAPPSLPAPAGGSPGPVAGSPAPGGGSPAPAHSLKRRRESRAARRSPRPRASQAPPAAAATRSQPAAKPRAAKPQATAAADIGTLTCPRCRQGALITGSRGWGCARWREGCRFVVWFETAGKRLTAAQLRALVTTGKTRKATFVDASGREVTARLVLDPARDGGVRVDPV